MSGKDNKGFTLIELILVIAIIGMLLAVAVPSLTKSRDAADSVAAMAHLRAIHTNQSMYRFAKGRYARLGELNTFAGDSLGRTVGSTLRQRDFTYLLFPTPSDTTLRTGYDVIAYRIREGRVISHFQVSEDGLIRTILP
jgi:prepilin-type N-terminal cleavage/methylation domain-containing protein